MGRRLGLKAVLIGALVVVLLVPLLMLRGLVHERQMRSLQVADEIAQSASRPQTLVGPLLRLRIERTERVTTTPADQRFGSAVVEEHRRTEERVLAPLQLEIDSEQRTEERRRGLFSTRLYHDDSTLRARFAMPAALVLDEGLVGWRIVGATLVLGLGDSRGIGKLRLVANDRELEPGAGTGVAWLADGVHAPLPDDALDPGPVEVEVRLALTGTGSVSWVPVGGDTRVRLRSDWPHPGFRGERLPDTHAIGPDGFEAQWTVSKLASRAHQRVQDCEAADARCNEVAALGFGVALVDPVDRYLKTDRAMKYALLFLVLIFGAVFLIEALAPAVAVHPFQYALTGLALAAFFLLLLALTEHIGFGPAYALAAVACVALIVAYLWAPLGRGRTLRFGALLAGLYALLYGLLQSEDHALLIGALALFALLATAMLLTRRVDWYRLGATAGAD